MSDFDQQPFLEKRSGLRLRPQRSARALVGGAIVAVSLTALGAVLARAGDEHEVLVLTRRVEAGAQLTPDDLRVASVATDDDIPHVPASVIDAVVGRFALTALAPGSMLRWEALQARPLVSPGTVLMSVAVTAGRLPAGLREGSRVVLIVTSPSECAGDGAVSTVEATVVALPRGIEAVSGDDSSVTFGLTVEVPDDPESVRIIGSAERVGVGVLPPGLTLPPSNPPGPTGEACAVDAATGEIEGGTGVEPGAPPATGVTGLDLPDAVVMATTTTTVPG